MAGQIIKVNKTGKAMKKVEKCWKLKGTKEQKNNTRDSNVVPHRSTNRAR